MTGRGENRPPGARGRPDTQRPWVGGLLPVSAPQHQHLRLPDSPEGHAEVSGAAVPTVHEQKDPDGSRWKRRERCVSQWGGLGPAGSSPPRSTTQLLPIPHPPPPFLPPPPSSPPPGFSLPPPHPPPAPPGHRGPSLGVQFHRGVSHPDITDKGRPVPPKMELILCGPPNPTISTDSPGRPKAPRQNTDTLIRQDVPMAER